MPMHRVGMALLRTPPKIWPPRLRMPWGNWTHGLPGYRREPQSSTTLGGASGRLRPDGKIPGGTRRRYL